MMKRLTYYSMKGSENDGWYLKSGVSKQDAVDRLAAYENSKLEPEEIKSLQAEWSVNLKSLEFYRQAQIDEANNAEWISVKDRMPEEDDDVLILVRETEYYGIHKEKRAVYRWVFTGWRVDDVWATTYCHGHRKIDEEAKTQLNCEYEVTHWMPLPEPPKEE
nr:MAG TPA: Protein of unknown function (DUF551) [Caudoviricetes sp.]